MIDVDEVLPEIPDFKTFCSVDMFQTLIERLRMDSRFEVTIAGESTNRVPIHHVRFGTGSVRALFVGFQHCMEPLTGLTIFSLIDLLMRKHDCLLSQDVEWHFIPCIDPDGALLNETWTQRPFSFASYMRGFHQQPRPEQVDLSFPIRYKTVTWSTPSREAAVLRSILDQTRPHFFYPGHDARPAIGSWYYISRDVDHSHYVELHRLLEKYGMPLIAESRMHHSRRFARGVYELCGFKNTYDRMAQIAPSIAQSAFVNTGAASYDYLGDLEPESLSFVGELTNIRYTASDLSQATGECLRDILLHIAADNMALASMILEAWDDLNSEIRTGNAFYRKIVAELISQRDKLHEGLTTWHQAPTRALLSDRIWARDATEADRLDAYIGASGRFGFLCHAYEFVRLLRQSTQTAPIKNCIERLEHVFDDALRELEATVDFRKFEAIDCSTLARAHTGSALIILNAVLRARAAAV